MNICLNSENKLFDKNSSKPFCKEEPVDISESQCHSSSSSHNSFPDIDDVDELQAILASLTEDGDDLQGEIIKDMDLGLKEVVGSCGVDTKNKTKTTKSPSFDKKPSVNQCAMIQDPIYERQTSDKFCDSRLPSMGFGSSQATCIHHGENPESLRAPHLLGDTGPAAETLKQMAAQHQNQEGSPFGKGNSQSPFNAKCYTGPITRDGNQQQYHYSSGNNYGPGPMTSYSEESKLSIPPACVPQQLADKQMGIDMTYGATKPLTHYGGSMVSSPSSLPSMSTEQPSSLQQLQNQVHSHFNQGSTDRPSSASFINHAYSTANPEMHVNPQLSANQLNVHGSIPNTSRFVTDHSIQVVVDKKQESYPGRIMNNTNLSQTNHHAASKNTNLQGVTNSLYAMDKKPVMSMPPHIQPPCVTHTNKRPSGMESNFIQQTYTNSDHSKTFHRHPSLNTDCPTSLSFVNPSTGTDHPVCSDMAYVQKPSIPVVSRQYNNGWNSGCGKTTGNENMHPLMPMRPVEYGYPSLPMTSAVNCEVQNTFSENRCNAPHDRQCQSMGLNEGSVAYDNRNCYNAPGNLSDPNERKLVELGTSSRANSKNKLKGQMVAPHINTNQFHSLAGNQEQCLSHTLYPLEHNQNYSSPPTHNYM